MTIQEAKYIGNSHDSFDEKGNSKINIFRNTSDFAKMEEDAELNYFENTPDLYTLETFLELTDIDQLGLEIDENNFIFYFYTETPYSPKVYVAYDIDNDKHYFFV